MATTFNINGSGEVMLVEKARKASDKTQDDTVRKTERIVEREAQKKGRGLDWTERRVDALDTLSKSKERIFMLIYDIPTSLDSEVPNPSPILWNFGARLNLSCWALPESSINAERVQKLLEHWREHFIESHIVPYSEEATRQVREIARRKLEEEVIGVHQSLFRRLDAAAKRLDEARAELDKDCEAGKDVPYLMYERLEERRESSAKQVLKEAQSQMAAAVNCARVFDDTEHFDALFNGVRAAIRSECLALNAHLQAKAARESRMAPPPDEVGKGVPVSYALSKEMRQYTFLPLQDGKNLVLIHSGGDAANRTREEMPVEEGRKTYARLKREGWKPC